MTSAAWHSFRVNGEAWGEVAIDAKIASEAGVPVIMVSGDDRLCREADAFLPGVERACVKHGAGRQTALCLSPARGNALVRETMKRAVLRLNPKPEFLLIDGNKFRPFDTYTSKDYKTVVKGDATYASIAAASVLAKTWRDEYMKKIALEYPQYGWDRNMGYPTPEHIAAIKKYGYTPYHRMSFHPKELEPSLFG